MVPEDSQHLADEITVESVALRVTVNEFDVGRVLQFDRRIELEGILFRGGGGGRGLQDRVSCDGGENQC